MISKTCHSNCPQNCLTVCLVPGLCNSSAEFILRTTLPGHLPGRLWHFLHQNRLLANVSNFRSNGAIFWRMFRILWFGAFQKRECFEFWPHGMQFLSECFEFCFEKFEMSRAICLSEAEIGQCFEYLRAIIGWKEVVARSATTSFGPIIWCKYSKPSPNSASDRQIARDISNISEQNSKHSLKIAFYEAKLRNIRVFEKL